MKKDDIVLSIIIISYNQEKYIRAAIDSVLRQKVNFKYELILADDCSPDNTSKILEEYKKKYPNVVKIAYRKENLGAAKNILNAGAMCRGKYVTLLEGDDYWCNENKLQVQVDFLEKSSEYIGIAHLQQARDLENNFLGTIPKWIKNDTEVVFKDFEKHKNFSFSTCLYRNIFVKKEYSDELNYLLSLHRIVGDLQLCYFLLEHGKIYVLNEPMMVYRVIKKPGESNYNSNNSIEKINSISMNILSEIDKYSNYKHNFFRRYLSYFTIIFCGNIIKGKFGEIINLIKKSPRRYRLKLIFLMPFWTIKILHNKKRRKKNEQFL